MTQRLIVAGVCWGSVFQKWRLSPLFFFLNPGRLVLNVVGVVYVLGFSAGLVALPASQQDVVLSGFKGRALLSTTVDGIKVKRDL